MKLQRFTGDDHWSALYVDGKLDTVGDHYLIDERISELIGVEEHHTNAFLKGGDNYENALETADEVFAHVSELKLKAIKDNAEAEELEKAAADLLSKAKSLRG